METVQHSVVQFAVTTQTKLERMTEVQSTSKQSPAPSTIPTLTSVYWELDPTLCWANSACASLPLAVSQMEEGLFHGEAQEGH